MKARGYVEAGRAPAARAHKSWLGLAPSALMLVDDAATAREHVATREGGKGGDNTQDVVKMRRRDPFFTSEKRPIL
jgi:hypothetical protein